jgi:uncharacterized protein (TIGR04255 family)
MRTAINCTIQDRSIASKAYEVGRMASADIQFSSPPATEVLQGIFFDPPPRFTVPLQGALWAESFREDFPNCEEKAPIEETQEWFGTDVLKQVGGLRWRVSDKPDSPRIWAKSKTGDRILQLQANVIITNWLKKKDADPYIRYPIRKNDLAERLNALQKFFEKEGLGGVQPTSCLMTYVNHVEVESIEKVPATAARIFKFASEPSGKTWLAPPDQFSFGMSYPMRDRMGRLHITANAAFQDRPGNGKQPLLRFDLTAKGQPKERTIDGALAWLDVGHEWIVQGFVDVTNPEWHKKWGKQ